MLWWRRCAIEIEHMRFRMYGISRHMDMDYDCGKSGEFLLQNQPKAQPNWGAHFFFWRSQKEEERDLLHLRIYDPKCRFSRYEPNQSSKFSKNRIEYIEWTNEWMVGYWYSLPYWCHFQTKAKHHQHCVWNQPTNSFG